MKKTKMPGSVAVLNFEMPSFPIVVTGIIALKSFSIAKEINGEKKELFRPVTINFHRTADFITNPH